MNLSKNFTLAELCATDTGITNTPDLNQQAKLMYLANYLLQPIRDKWGPIKINSGFRSKAVHQYLTDHGYPTSKTSQHLDAEAADIVPVNVPCEVVWDWACKNLIYGQCILEEHEQNKILHKWIHISLVRVGGNNLMAMIYKDGKYEMA